MEIDFPSLQFLENVGMFSLYEESKQNSFAKLIKTNSQCPIKYEIGLQGEKFVLETFKTRHAASGANAKVEKLVMWINTTTCDTWNIKESIVNMCKVLVFDVLIVTGDKRADSMVFEEIRRELNIEAQCRPGLDVPEWFFCVSTSNISVVGSNLKFSFTFDPIQPQVANVEGNNGVAAGGEIIGLVKYKTE